MIQDARDTTGDCISLARAQRLSRSGSISSLMKRLKAASSGSSSDLKPSPQVQDRDQPAAGISLSQQASGRPAGPRVATADLGPRSRKPAVPRQSPGSHLSGRKAAGPTLKRTGSQTSSEVPSKTAYQAANRMPDDPGDGKMDTSRWADLLLTGLREAMRELSCAPDAREAPGHGLHAPETLQQKSLTLLSAAAERRKSLLSLAVQAVERVLQAERWVGHGW